MDGAGDADVEHAGVGLWNGPDVSPYIGIVILLVIAAGFVALTIITSMIVGPGRYNRAKYDSYECGIEPTPQPVGGGRFPVK